MKNGCTALTVYIVMIQMQNSTLPLDHSLHYEMNIVIKRVACFWNNSFKYQEPFRFWLQWYCFQNNELRVIVLVIKDSTLSSSPLFIIAHCTLRSQETLSATYRPKLSPLTTPSNEAIYISSFLQHLHGNLSMNPLTSVGYRIEAITFSFCLVSVSPANLPY